MRRGFCLALAGAIATAAAGSVLVTEPTCEPPRRDATPPCESVPTPRQPTPAVEAGAMPWSPLSAGDGALQPSSQSVGQDRTVPPQDNPSSPEQGAPRITRRLSWRQIQ